MPGYSLIQIRLTRHLDSLTKTVAHYGTLWHTPRTIVPIMQSWHLRASTEPMKSQVWALTPPITCPYTILPRDWLLRYHRAGVSFQPVRKCCVPPLFAYDARVCPYFHTIFCNTLNMRCSLEHMQMWPVTVDGP